MATVVVVDDETMNADALAFMLSAVGLEVHTAADGQQGLGLIAQLKPDVVITDFMMPIMTGLELAQALRADRDTASIPIILLTAAQADTGRDHPELFDLVFEKPCFPAEVVASVVRMAGAAR